MITPLIFVIIIRTDVIPPDNLTISGNEIKIDIYENDSFVSVVNGN